MGVTSGPRNRSPYNRRPKEVERLTLVSAPNHCQRGSGNSLILVTLSHAFGAFRQNPGILLWCRIKGELWSIVVSFSMHLLWERRAWQSAPMQKAMARFSALTSA